MTNQRTHYDELEVQRNASTTDIRAAWKRLIAEWHPDKFANADAVSQTIAQEKSKRLNNARDILMDAEKRRAYDATLPVAFTPAPAPAAAAATAFAYTAPQSHYYSSYTPEPSFTFKKSYQPRPAFNYDSDYSDDDDASGSPFIPRPHRTYDSNTKTWGGATPGNSAGAFFNAHRR